MSSSNAALLASFAGVAGTVSRIIMGYLTNSASTKKRVVMIVLVNLALAATIFTLPLSTTFAALAIACAALGWLQGCQNILATIVTLDVGGLIDESMVCLKTCQFSFYFTKFPKFWKYILSGIACVFLIWRRVEP